MGTIPQIISVYPAPNAPGIPIGDQVVVIFDQEMDRSSINSGTFVLTAPDNGVIFGPGLQPINNTGQDILNSPYYGGFVEATISFSRVDISGSSVDDDLVDTEGDGSLWRTAATLIPSQPLRQNVDYHVLLAGDEDQDNLFDSGVKTRTVFDPLEVDVTGSGTLEFAGGYTGQNQRNYILEITSGGATGVATYKWWNELSPLVAYDGVTVTGDRELEDGIIVNFDPDGTFVVGDKWSVVVIPLMLMPNNYVWSFSTGSGSIAVPPSSHSTSGIESIAAASASLKIVSIEPAHQATNLDPSSVTEIVITFNKEVDESTIIDENITIWSEPVDGNKFNTDIPYAGIIAKILSVNGRVVTAQIT